MSYNRTVHCGHCYTSGHNRTSCPKMRIDAKADPDGYAAREVARHDARKAQPKICSYCDESGHTRAGCDTAKQHKAQFIIDAKLWRSALAKWMQEAQLGVGALVRCNDASYHRGDIYMYPRDEGYIAPVGLVMGALSLELTHYSGIMGTNEWGSGNELLCFHRLDAAVAEATYRKVVGLALPSIPGIVPRYGKGYYGNERLDRADRLNNVDWEVVSAAPATINSDGFLGAEQLRKMTKHHFAAPQDRISRNFQTFGDFQRTQLQQYVNGEIELSEMKDPEVPGTNT